MHEFTDMHYYWYYRQCGISKLHEFQYKEALKMFLKAEELGNLLKIYNEGPYYNIASCLTNIGYAYLAIEYLKMAEAEAVKSSNNRYNVYIRNLFALNYSILGQHGRAISLLEGCLRGEKEKANAKGTIGAFYIDMGMIYHRMGKLSDAIKCLDVAGEYFQENSDSFTYNMYCKAYVLLANSKTSEGLDCLDKGLDVSKQHTLMHVLLLTLKHSINLKEPESLQYMQTTGIPQLLEYGEHLLVAEYYEKLGVYYQEIKKYKTASIYMHLALDITKKLMKGDLNL